MIQIRRVFTHVEEIQHEFGPLAPVPLLRGAIGAVLTNPYAGRYEPDILPMMEALQDVGLDMAQRLLRAMAVPAERIETYGKGAVVGAAGELEHGALWHVPGGYAMRELLGWISAQERDRGIRLFQRAGLPVVPPEEMTEADFLEHMAIDKKVIDGRLRLVLLRHMGEAVVTDDYPKEILQATLGADYRALAQLKG